MVELVKEYIDKRVSLLKIEATEKSAKVSGVSIYFFLLLVLGVSFFAFFSIACGLWIGFLLGNYAYGMFIIAGILLLLLIIFITLKKQIINLVMGRFIDIIFDED